MPLGIRTTVFGATSVSTPITKQWQKRWLHRLLPVIVLASIAIAMPGLRERSLELQDGESVRTHLWSMCCAMLWQHPDGIGWANFGGWFAAWGQPHLWNAYYPVAINDYLHLGVEGGLAVFAGVIGFTAALITGGIAVVRNQLAHLPPDCPTVWHAYQLRVVAASTAGCAAFATGAMFTNCLLWWWVSVGMIPLVLVVAIEALIAWRRLWSTAILVAGGTTTVAILVVLVIGARITDRQGFLAIGIAERSEAHPIGVPRGTVIVHRDPSDSTDEVCRGVLRELAILDGSLAWTALSRAMPASWSPWSCSACKRAAIRHGLRSPTERGRSVVSSWPETGSTGVPNRIHASRYWPFAVGWPIPCTNPAHRGPLTISPSYRQSTDACGATASRRSPKPYPTGWTGLPRLNRAAHQRPIRTPTDPRPAAVTSHRPPARPPAFPATDRVAAGGSPTRGVESDPRSRA